LSFAAFGYSDKLGADEAFTPGETTGTRRLEFTDPAGELFTFETLAYAYQRLGGGAAASGGAASGTGGPNPAGTQSSSPLKLLQFTVNPRLSLVTVKLISRILP
jgi:hypothetical protein